MGLMMNFCIDVRHFVRHLKYKNFFKDAKVVLYVFLIWKV